MWGGLEEQFFSLGPEASLLTQDAGYATAGVQSNFHPTCLVPGTIALCDYLDHTLTLLPVKSGVVTINFCLRYICSCFTAMK